jgi:hypothetical protein
MARRRAGVLYGLPKVHKKNNPVRPIISAVGTYNYHLAKYLDEIIKPLVPKKFTLNDEYDFVNKIGYLKIENDPYIVSFDVESLPTNVQTKKKIDIVLDLAFERDKTTKKFKKNRFHGFSKSQEFS